MNIALPIGNVDTTRIDSITAQTLAPMVRDIDAGEYPEAIMRAYGAAGAYGSHIVGETGVMDAILAMSRAGEVCTSTAFCMWCQDALGWYIYSSDNEFLKSSIGPRVASGEILGGTGLSNPMKAVNGIEAMRLKAERVDGGYKVKGVLPWVSNLSEGGYFGIIFDAPIPGSDAVKKVMAVAFADWDGVKLKLDHDFVAMGGTATCQVMFKDAFIPDDYILADPAEEFIKRIRGGFVLMQCGMASGMVQSCIDLMEQVRGPLGHVNCYLEKQPADFAADLADLMAEITDLARTPYDPSNAYFRRVLTARLRGGEMAVESAHYAMLHCGARGYVSQGAAQRRLREAYFVAIVTPATKQLRKMLADLPA